jgi:hypothetical protein
MRAARTTLLLLFGLLPALSAGCGMRVAPSASGPLTEPRAAWIIRWGVAGSRESECRSDGQTQCTLTASSSGRPVEVAASIYLYAAGSTTKYRGALLPGFIQGVRETRVDYDIAPNRRPTGVTTAGRVITQPGSYELRLAFLAEVPERTDPYQFAYSIPVRVVAGAAGDE